jgi:hypothetical protein
MKQYSISLTFHLQSNCRWKQRLEGQTTAKRNGGCAGVIKQYPMSRLTFQVHSNCRLKLEMRGTNYGPMEGWQYRWSSIRTAWVTQHPPVHTIQKIPFWNFMDGMKLSPRGQFIRSVFFSFSFSGHFFPLAQFFSFWGQSFYLFIFPSPLIPSFFWELLPTPQPTYHPSSYQPTYLPHPADCSPPTSFCSHLHR